MAISYVMLALLTVFSFFLIVLVMKAGNYSEFVEVLNKKDFAGCAYYGLGFAMIDMIKPDFKSDAAHKIREQASILYGRKYADFYVRVLYAQTYTYIAMFLYVFMFLGCIIGSTDGLIFLVLGLISTVAIYKYYLNRFATKLDGLNLIYMRDFPNAVSTIALLVNGGMFLRDAWKQVAFSSEEPLYMQMRTVVEDMNNGVSEIDAIFSFANRCSTKEIRKFSTLITQAIEKGGRDLADSLVKQADLLMNEKRQLVLQQGEKASNKLMMPIMGVFIGILIMIMVPIMSNISM